MDPLKQPLKVVCFLYIIQSLKSELTVTRHLTVIRNLTVTRTKKLIVKLLISSPDIGQMTSPLSWINFQCKLRKLIKCTLKSIEFCLLTGSNLYSQSPYKFWFVFLQANHFSCLVKNLMLEVFVIYLVLAQSRKHGIMLVNDSARELRSWIILLVMYKTIVLAVYTKVECI